MTDDKKKVGKSDIHPCNACKRNESNIVLLFIDAKPVCKDLSDCLYIKGTAATPMQKTLTETEIREDVQMYQDRIKEAQLRLAGLPASVATYNERKRLQAQRRALNQDIEHIKGLIRIAEAAL